MVIREIAKPKPHCHCIEAPVRIRKPERVRMVELNVRDTESQDLRPSPGEHLCREVTSDYLALRSDAIRKLDRQVACAKADI